MASGVGYFGDNYFASNYWDAEFWAPSGAIQGDYWGDTYWNVDYWNLNYWLETASDPGDIHVTDDATLTLTPLVTQVTTGPTILATTETLTLTAFNTVAGLGIDPPITTATLTLTAFNPTLGLSGYVLGDIDLTFSPESTITITEGAAPPVKAVPLEAFHPTTSTPDGVDVGVSLPPNLGLTAFPTIAQNNVNLQPIPASLTLTAFNSPAAGIGELIKVTRPGMTFAAPTHTIEGTSAVSAVTPLKVLNLNVFATVVAGVSPDVIPPPTFVVDAIQNADAAAFPSHYEICERSGFRVRRGELVEEWTGVMVRKESFERRNAQDFVRGVSDDQHGSPRPEQDDQFVQEKFPGGVTLDDL